MSEPTAAQIADQINRSIEAITQQIIVPRIEQIVQERIDDAVYRSIQHMDPGLIRAEIRRSVSSLVMERIEVSVTPVPPTQEENHLT